MSKENYAAALRDQIASKRDGGGYGSVGGVGGGYGGGDRRSSFAGGGAALLGLGAADNSVFDIGHQNAGAMEHRQNSYAQDLKAQIDERANKRSDARNARLAADKEDDVRVEHERAHYQNQVQRERDSQAERGRVVQARADALEQFLSEKGEAPRRGAMAAEGGYAAPQVGRQRKIQFQESDAPYGAANYGQENRAPSAPVDWSGCGALPGQHSAPNGPVSSNRYASGGNQNCGNVLTDKPSSRVLAPPGGKSSFSLGWS